MKYILLKLLAYDCGQEYEVSDHEVLIKDGSNPEEDVKTNIEEFLLSFYEIEELPIDVVYKLSQFKLSGAEHSIFEVGEEYHNMEYMETVHVEVVWSYIEVYNKGANAL